jgi:glycosyltransferase involved in cell wall biosynthesis
VSVLNYRWFGFLIAREATRLGMGNACLWIYSPEYAAALEQIPHAGLVFDLCDDIEAYHVDPAGSRASRVRITRLLERADLTVVTSPTLADDVAARARGCILVPNGYDESLFDNQPRPVPDELAAIPRPIAGFVGALFGFIDYELLYRTALEMPEVSFVFVGRTHNEGRRGVERLRTLTNTYFLGAKPQAKVPAYVSGFDVCLAPFKTDGVARAVSPLKIYEYLACGKPVVSTPLEGLSREETGRWVRFAASAEFPGALREVLAEPDPSGVQAACAKAAMAYSWSRRFEKLEPHLESLLKV